MDRGRRLSKSTQETIPPLKNVREMAALGREPISFSLDLHGKTRERYTALESLHVSLYNPFVCLYSLRESLVFFIRCSLSFVYKTRGLKLLNSALSMPV